MHEGHRQRMYDKLKSGVKLPEHELLEILLFNAYPRKNTNPVAHLLLDTFGSIEGVFNAEVSALTAVEGVGESVALYLKCIGECVNRTDKRERAETVLKSYEDFKNFACFRLRGKAEECLELYCIEKSGKVKKIFSFTDNADNKVEVSIDRVAGALATVKPYGLLIAHNHLSGSSQPSSNDDIFMKEIQLLCSINNVHLFDHCIYAGENNVFSYFLSGKIDEIKKEYSFEKIMADKYKGR